MKCNKCGAELKSGAKFCTVCGEKVEVQRTCPNCGKPVKDGAKFCRECGAAVNTAENPIPQAQPAPVKTEQVGYAAPAPVKTSKNKAAIGIIAAVIAVVVVVGVVGAAALTKFIKAKSPAVADYSLYIKDNELYLADAENEPIKLTDDFFGMSLKRECEATPSDRGEGWYNYDAESYTESYGNYEYSDCVPYEDDKRDIDNVIKSLCKADYSTDIQDLPDDTENHSTVPAGNLYRVPIENNVPREPEIYNTEVADMLVSPVGDSDILYFKNMWSWTGEGAGDFYINKDLLVYMMNADSGYNFVEETGELRYQGDDGVYSYKDGKPIFIGEDASLWSVEEETDEESPFFEEDGNVYLLNDDGSRKLIDTDISHLV